MEPIRVLVTGAGSAVGQGIIKSLRIADLPVEIISADISPLNAALYRTRESLLIPKVESEGALEKMTAIIRERKIQVVMIGSEFDLVFFSRNKTILEKKTGAVVIVSPHETVQIANDKWLTAEFLRERGLPYALSYVPSSVNDAVRLVGEWGCPVILKPRTGTSARHVYVVHTPDELRAWYSYVPSPVIQRMISVPAAELDNEFTCSIFKCADGAIMGPFTARRTLQRGHSKIVEVDDFKALYPLLLKIGKNMDIMGPLNIQLMVGTTGPVPFEFNARFSGTTAVRAHFGFNEPAMAIQHFFFKQKLPTPTIRKGIAFRYDEEVFLNGVNAKELSEPFIKGEVRPWF